MPTIDWLSERECDFLDDLLLEVKKGAGGEFPVSNWRGYLH